jgi:hypothetical protein
MQNERRRCSITARETAWKEICRSNTGGLGASACLRVGLAYFVQLSIGNHVAARCRSFEETKDGIAFNASLLLPVDNERSRVSWPSSRKAQVQASTHIQGTTVLMKAICSATVPLPWNSVNQIGRGANALMASAHSYSAQVLHASGP